MTKHPALRVRELAASIPWCITEPALKTILSVAARENADPEQVAIELGRPLANTRSVRIREGVAVIPIQGPIFRRANLFSEISGGTSVEVLAQDFARALNDTSVRAILLSVDSPGGEANGIGEMAAMIHAARSVKPITAYVGGMGASAAYWLASAASTIVCDASALIGSIGTVMAIPNKDQPAEETEFVSSQSPNKRPDPETETGRGELQTIVDSLTAVFVGAVAQYRGLSPDAVIAGGRQGGILVGQQAVDAGLADRLGSEESTLMELIADTPRARQPVAASAPVVFASFTSGGAFRSTTHPMETRMSDQQDTPILAPPTPPPVNDTVVNAQVQAYVAQLQTQYEAAQKSAMERAQLEFERKLAEMQARQQIESFAQDIHTPSLTHQHALPGDPSETAAFLLSIPSEPRKVAMGMLRNYRDVGLVSFEEIGNGQGDDERADHERTLERVESIKAAKLASGMTQSAALSAAITAVGKDAYNAARQAQKGGR